MGLWNSVCYYYEMSDGSIVKSEMFYAYDYGIRIYQEQQGHILCIMEDKTVLHDPRYITPQEWTFIVMRCKGITEPPYK